MKNTTPKPPSATADKTRNYNVQIAVGPLRQKDETLAQYIERTSEPKAADKIAHTQAHYEGIMDKAAAKARSLTPVAHTPVFCHEIQYLDGNTLSVASVRKKPRETINIMFNMKQQRDELLEACKAALQAMGDTSPLGLGLADACGSCRAAIAKAEGKTNEKLH